MIAVIKAPQINANDDQVGVVGWHVEDGARVVPGDDLVDLETSKAVVTIPAEAAGFVRRLVPKGAIVKVGSPLCNIAATAEEATAAISDEAEAAVAAPEVASRTYSASEPAEVAVTAPARANADTRFSKGALAVIEALGLDQQSFQGRGLVTARSIEASRNPERVVPIVRPAAGNGGGVLPVPRAARDEPLSLGKRAEVDALTTGEAGLINSTLTVHFNSAQIRSRLEESDSFGGSIQPIILYELSRLLQHWPQFTAFFAGNHTHFYDRVDLGVALDLGRGLKVVTITSANELMPTQFFERMIEYGLKYNENQIRPDELIGSTFTVTDLSGYGVLQFRALINGQQSAILGIGGDNDHPDYPMTLNLTFDHRVANGREAALFLQELRRRIVSYAPVAPTSGGRRHEAAAQPHERAFRTDGRTLICGRCGVDQDTYRKEAGPDAYMFASFSEDGHLQPVCHRCSGGFF